MCMSRKKRLTFLISWSVAFRETPRISYSLLSAILSDGQDTERQEARSGGGDDTGTAGTQVMRVREEADDESQEQRIV